MKFLHISDLHYTKEIKERGGLFREVFELTCDPFEQLKFLNINEKDFDFVMVSGDLCEEGTVEEYKQIKADLETYFACPIIVTVGNHDHIAHFNEAYGDVFFVEYFEDIRVISFKSASEDHNDGLIDEETCLRLKEELNKKWKGKTILMTHHHLIKDQFQMPTAQYSEEFAQLIEQSKIDLILTGHTHHLYQGFFQGKPYLTSGSLSFVAENECDKLHIYMDPSALQIELNGSVIVKKLVSSQDKKHIYTLELS